ncbi:hypothetical protein T10_11422 [Trichinella papuae]|uniref:Uncharacterized protein n=1 Tax=Trichinella papuae TaxID=268474 RepID=A0A0V1MKZ3_9BILA|nr:hypothetical protein T10_13124 [Trichinella papuae]KRZ72260.1 hypothetical protein T10_11422 [Trichinella papuae]
MTVEKLNSMLNHRRGTIIGDQAVVHMREDADVKVFTARAVTFVLRLNVKESLRCTWLEGHIKDTTV